MWGPQHHLQRVLDNFGGIIVFNKDDIFVLIHANNEIIDLHILANKNDDHGHIEINFKFEDGVEESINIPACGDTHIISKNDQNSGRRTLSEREKCHYIDLVRGILSVAEQVRPPMRDTLKKPDLHPYLDRLKMGRA